MDWNRKRRIIELYKGAIERKNNKIDFFDFVLSNIKDFDQQAWEIFFCLVDSKPKNIRRSSYFFKQLVKKIDTFDYSGFTIHGAAMIETKKIEIKKELDIIKQLKNLKQC